MNLRWILTMLVTIAIAYADMRSADRAMSQYDSALKAWEAKFTTAPDDAARLILLESRPSPRRTTQMILKFIGAELNDPSTMRGIAWIYENDAGFLQHPDAGEAGKAIRNALIRSHYNKPGAGDLCVIISQNFNTQDLAFLEKVAEQAASTQEQGMASLAVSIALSNLGADSSLVAKRLEHLRSAIKKIPKEKEIGDRKVTDIIGDQLYVIQYLSKGRKAQCGAEVIGIYTGNSETLRQKIADREVTWRNAFDQNREITKNYRINQTPTVFLLDKEGKIQSIGEPNALVNLSMQALADGG